MKFCLLRLPWQKGFAQLTLCKNKRITDKCIQESHTSLDLFFMMHPFSYFFACEALTQPQQCSQTKMKPLFSY